MISGKHTVGLKFAEEISNRSHIMKSIDKFLGKFP